MKKRRNSQCDNNIQPLQLTFDQKPDLPEELTRITQCGGRVDKIQNAEGVKFGPYRVWDADLETPGLSVSRALGDSACRKLGIIADPICSSHQVVCEDYFIVVGSDGLWDVMDNSDVVNFVESYRERCKRKVRASVQGRLVNPGNSCIAQMLCEEARVRWFSIVKEEGICIDDISCVILEIRKSGEVMAFKSCPGKVEEEKAIRESIRNENERDPRRGSLAIPEGHTPVLI